ncbi:MAG: hypothetical protein HC783_18895 [Rhodobacteraceae bacterium]|nr:hypothetical protein [Paracoccaceae bacterium]
MAAGLYAAINEGVWAGVLAAPVERAGFFLGRSALFALLWGPLLGFVWLVKAQELNRRLGMRMVDGEGGEGVMVAHEASHERPTQLTSSAESVRRHILEPQILAEIDWLKSTQATIVQTLLLEKSRRFWFGVVSVALLVWGAYAGMETGPGAVVNPLWVVVALVLAVSACAISIYSTFSLRHLRALLQLIEDRLVRVDAQHFGADTLGHLLRSKI